MLGREGASRPLPPNPPPPLKPSQAKPSQFKGRPVYLPSLCGQANPIRPQASRAAVLTASLPGTDTAKPSPTHFFQGDHVYESPPSLFRARNPLPRYLYLTQLVPSRVCSRRRSHVHTVTSLHRHKQNATKVAHHSRLFDQVCAWGGGGRPPPPPQPPTPAETKPSQAKPV